jgi:hypothetical protein
MKSDLLKELFLKVAGNLLRKRVCEVDPRNWNG